MKKIEKVMFFCTFSLLCVFVAGGYYLYNISYKNSTIEILNTNVELLNDSLSFGKFEYYSIKRVPFNLKNNGNQPLVISSINTSCNCTVAKYEKKPILQGETTVVVLEYKPNSLGFFSKTADVICNVPKGYVRLKISGEVVENK